MFLIDNRHLTVCTVILFTTEDPITFSAKCPFGKSLRHNSSSMVGGHDLKIIRMISIYFALRNLSKLQVYEILAIIFVHTCYHRNV